VTDIGVSHLSGLTAMQHLDLSGCVRVIDRGLAQLSGLTALQHLGLSRFNLSDSVVAYLSCLTLLQHLDLSLAHYYSARQHCVTDRGVAPRLE
jgi:F-box and leucine-rich repeat protein 14